MKTIILQIAAALLITTTIWANPTNPRDTSQHEFGYERFAGTTLFVHALDGLKLRQEPSLKAPVITILDYGEPITLLGSTPEDTPFNVGYTTGKWVHVDVNGIVGYVFDGFTSTLPIPEVLPNTDYLTTLLERYVHYNFDLVSADTIERSSEMDDRFHVKFNYLFEDNVRFKYDAYWQSESATLEVPGIRIMDAYHLVKELFTVAQIKHDGELIFKVNDAGTIYEISDRYRSDIIIRDRGEYVSIQFKTYAGC